ncbi:MAG TPA: response regulator [Candidatus Nanoarchaeia archaeon]|nr:response regulator [Candidatus Nanoarchaeia archaeon]
MKKILVVDDELSVRITVRKILEYEGFEVSEAEDADVAWNKIKKSKPDLILLDVMMPGTTVKVFIENIKKNLALKSIKIILLTAVMGAKMALSKEKNIVAVVGKPFTKEELLYAVHKVCR